MRASNPLLNGAAATSGTPAAAHAGASSSSALRSRSVSRLAIITTSGPASASTRRAVAHTIVPTDTAPTIPSARRSARAGKHSSRATSRWSSGSCTCTMSTWSRPSRVRLSSSDRRRARRAVVEPGLGTAVADHHRAADLRRHHDVGARPSSERRAEAALALSGAVQRRRVEPGDAAVDALDDGGDGGRLVVAPEPGGEWCGAEDERRAGDRSRHRVGERHARP